MDYTKYIYVEVYEGGVSVDEFEQWLNQHNIPHTKMDDNVFACMMSKSEQMLINKNPYLLIYQ